MRLSLNLLVLWVLGLLSMCNEKPIPINASEINQEALIARLDEFNQAFKEGNVEQLAAMITHNYQHTHGNSQAFGKESWLNYLRQRQKDMEEGKVQVDVYEMDQREITYYGDMAIVTARVKVQTQREGEARENEFRVTNIWVYEEGTWKRAGFHDGKIK